MASLTKLKSDVVKELERDAFLRNLDNVRENVVLIDGMTYLENLVKTNYIKNQKLYNDIRYNTCIRVYLSNYHIFFIKKIRRKQDNMYISNFLKF